MSSEDGEVQWIKNQNQLLSCISLQYLNTILANFANIHTKVKIMASMNVFLPDPMKEWVEDQVGGGLYSNASELRGQDTYLLSGSLWNKAFSFLNLFVKNSAFKQISIVSLYFQSSALYADGSRANNTVFEYSSSYFSSGLSLPITFGNVAFEVQGVVLDTGLGSPVDLLGDGVTDTVIDFTNLNGAAQTITVDGLNNPRTSRVFPGGESDLWNPSGVGAF